MDLKATSSMLQLLPLDNTRRWLYFCTHHLPVTVTPRPLPQQCWTPRCRRRMVQNLPRQVFYRPFVFLLLLGSCLVTVFVVPLLFLCFLWPWIDVRGRKQQWRDSGHGPCLIIWAEMRSDRILNLKKKKNLMKTKEKQVGKTREKVFTTVGVS